MNEENEFEYWIGHHKHPSNVRIKVGKVKPTIEIGAVVKVCPGQRHAWFQSNIGLVRKPIED